MAGFRNSIEKDSRKRAKVTDAPLDFDSIDEFLIDMRKNYNAARTQDNHNELAGRDDAGFVIGVTQWDPDVERKRRAKNKPVLTFNRLMAFISQVVNNRLMNETEIRVFPDKSGTKEVAELREAIIRSIFKNSNADYARDEASKYQVIGGQGGYCLSIDYTSDDVFEQEMRIKDIADPYSIALDPLSSEPTGADAEWGFVADDLPTSLFKKRYPWARDNSFGSTLEYDSVIPWYGEETTRVVAYWRMVTEGYKILVMLQDGTTQDVTDMEEFQWRPYVAMKKDGTPYVRKVPKRFAQMYLCAGNDILEGPYNSPFSSIPIYRVSGWEVTDGRRRYRWGLTRFLKDPMRLHNYWRSVQAEMLIATPRNKWLTTQAAIKGHEAKWRMAATSDDPFLYYNDGEMAPVHIPPPSLDPALMSEAQQTTQDLRDISNIHEAAMGAPSNEVSGVAVRARQNVSDVGTFIYRDRLRMADERCARNINEGIPYYYDTVRTMAIIGRDNKQQIVTINSSEETDITLGRYGLTVSVGPSTVTKRQLAAEQMTSVMNAIGPAAEMYMDLFAEAQDFPQADEFAKRARYKLVQSGMIPPDELTPQEQQMLQGAQQAQNMQQQLTAANAQAEVQSKHASANLSLAKAQQAKAAAYKAILDAQARSEDVAGKNSERGFNSVMAALDQHASLQQEDRQFMLDATSKNQQPEPTWPGNQADRAAAQPNNGGEMQ